LVISFFTFGRTGLPGKHHAYIAQVVFTFLVPASVFHGIIVVSLTSSAYHWASVKPYCYFNELSTNTSGTLPLPAIPKS
jgi:hypothetical protein